MNACKVTVRGVSNVLVLYTGGTIGMIRSHHEKGKRTRAQRVQHKTKRQRRQSRMKSECSNVLCEEPTRCSQEPGWCSCDSAQRSRAESAQIGESGKMIRQR